MTKSCFIPGVDFPHDSWWTQATFTFSDGTAIDFPMEKSEKPHVCAFEKKRVSWLTFDRLMEEADILRPSRRCPRSKYTERKYNDERRITADL